MNTLDYNPRSDGEPPWWYVFFGALMLGFSGYLYHYFIDFEANAGSRTINWFVALAYEIGGKWFVIGSFAACGIGLFCLGYAEYRRRKPKQS